MTSIRRNLAIVAATLLVSLAFLGTTDAELLKRTSDWCLVMADSSIETKSSTTTSCGGGGGGCCTSTTYNTTWAGATYTEHIDAFERYNHFNIQPDAGFQTATLAPLPARATDNVTRLLAEPTDLSIESEMLAKGITRQSVVDIVDAILLGDPGMDTTRVQASNLILNGQHNEAVKLLRPTKVAITLWCGLVDTPRSLEWVLGLPAPVDCGGTAAPDAVLRADLPCTTPSDCVSPLWVDGSSIRAIHNIRIRFQSSDADPFASSSEVAVGFQYEKHSQGLRFSPDRSLNLTAGLTALTTSPVLELRWLPVNSWLFTTSNTFYYNFGDHPTAGRQIAITPAQSTGSFHAKLTHQKYVDPEVHWRLVFEPLSGSSFGILEASLELSKGGVADLRVLRANDDEVILATDKGVEFGYQRIAASDAGLKHDLIVNTLAPNPFFHGHLKVTYRHQGVDQYTLQTVGLPKANRVRTDLGDAADANGNGDGVASVDISKGESAVMEWYRSVDFTGHVEKFPFNGHFKDVARARAATGPDAREGPDLLNDGNTLIAFGAAAWQSDDTSIPYDTDVRVDGKRGDLDGFQAAMDLTGSEPSGTWHWSAPDPRACTTECSGTTTMGTLNQSDNAPFNVYVWNIATDREDETRDEVPLSRCRPMHLDGSCH